MDKKHIILAICLMMTVILSPLAVFAQDLKPVDPFDLTRLSLSESSSDSEQAEEAVSELAEDSVSEPAEDADDEQVSEQAVQINMATDTESQGFSQYEDDDLSAATNDPERCYESFTYANALMRAENAYVRRKYPSVIEILQPLYANIQCIDDPNVVIELELMLGVANFEEGNVHTADSFFLNVLRTEPDHIVGSVITLPESSTRRIETLRTEHAEELDKLREERAPNTVIESLYVVTEKEEHPYWLNFMPFGVGVFQMHEKNWGIVHASIQGTGILMSILGGGMVEYYRGENYTFSHNDYPRAKAWQVVQIVGMTLLFADYVASVIHAIVIHEDYTLIIHSPTQTRPDIAAVSPLILPDGAGLAYGMSF